MATDTSKITTAADELSAGLTKGGGAAKTLGAEIANAIQSLDDRLSAIEAGGVTEPIEPPIEPPPTGSDKGKIEGFNAATGSSFKVGGVTFHAQNANKGWSLTKPDDYTLRTETRVGDLWTAGDNTSRSELAGSPKYPNGGTINLEFKVTIEPGAANTADWLCLNQMHATTQGPPPYALEMRGEKMAIVLRYQKSGQSAATDVYPWTDSAAVQRGRAYALKIESKYDPTGSGYLRAWRDGVQIVNYSGPLGIHTAEYYFKYGIYRSKSAGETFACKFSNMDIVAT